MNIYKLSDLGEFLNGLNYSRNEDGFEINIINVKDLFRDSALIKIDKLDKVKISAKRNIEKFTIKNFDLFFVRSSVKRSGIGLVGLVQESSKNILHCGFIIRFRIINDNIDPYYLLFMLRSPIYRKKIINLSSGSAITNITQKNLGNLEVIIPKLRQQKKISKILLYFENLILINKEKIKKLEEITQFVFYEWFVKYHFPGYEEVPLVDSGTDFGRIPVGWEIKHLEEICIITMGQSPKSEFYNDKGDGLPFHQGVTDFSIINPIDRIYCTIEKKIAIKSDILFSVRAPVGRINLANKKIVIGRGLCAIRNLNDFQSFTYNQLKYLFKNEDIIGSGTIFNAVTKNDMLKIKILYPPKELLVKYEKISKEIIKLIEKLDNKCIKLVEIRDLLLPKLISGQIDVSEMEIIIDEEEKDV